MAKKVKYHWTVDADEKKAIRRFLNGDRESLMYAIHWFSTAQGANHWADVYAGNKRLSKRSRRYLTKLLAL